MVSSIIFAENQINMKNFILSIAVFTTVLFSQAQTKVGTIDADYILGNMPEMASVEQGLQTYSANLQSQMEESVKKYDSLISEYKAKNESFSEEQLKTKQQEIITVENDLKTFKQKASMMLQMKKNELTQPLYAKIDAAMKQVIEAQKYTQILNASTNGLAYADPRFDITDAVLSKLGITIKATE